MRIQKHWPDTNWNQVWETLKVAPITEHARNEWYQAIHDIISTNVRLQSINVTPTDTCQRCKATDTLEHRLTNCGEAKLIWNHTKTAIATMLRTIPARIPNDWLLRPQFKIWPCCKMGTGSFPGLKCGRGVLLTTHPLLVARSWKSRAIPLSTLWATPGL